MKSELLDDTRAPKMARAASPATKRVLCLISAGAGGQDEVRARRLTTTLQRETGAQIDFEIADKTRGRRAVAAQMAARLGESFDLIYLEGTGIAAGWPLVGAGRRGQKYLVSSGDPISGYVKARSGALQSRIFGRYEQLLLRGCAGFVGWTPYLTGRALELGARRAITVEGGVNREVFRAPSAEEKRAARAHFDVPQGDLVCVVAGTLRWNERQSYCYGLELIEMLRFLKRRDVTMLIVGDGDGRAQLEARLDAPLRGRAIFTGRLPQPEVARALGAADIGFVTQTLDGLGNYRLTTKLPEYLAMGLGVAMSPVPGFYDYVGEAGWPLPARHPAQPEFHREAAAWLDALPHLEIEQKAAHAIPLAAHRFDAEALSRRFSRFVQDIW